MAKNPPIPEDALLCEACGYVLDHLRGAERCPECGRAVSASLPEARGGTVWQRRPGIVASLGVGIAVLWRPRETFRRMWPVADRRTWALLWINLVLAGVLMGATWVWVGRTQSAPGLAVWYMRDLPASATGGKTGLGTIVEWNMFIVPRPTWVAVMCVPVAIGAMWFLTWVESVGVRFFGRRRAWRVTWPIALSVCAHASIGWTIGAALYACIPFTRGVMWWLMDRVPEPPATQISLSYLVMAPVAGLFIGMLVFETLVYVGIRENRFANAVKAHADPMEPIGDQGATPAA